MDAVSMVDATRATPRHTRHMAAWRATSALPAIAGSFGLLLFGWMGTWEGLALLAWLAHQPVC